MIPPHPHPLLSKYREIAISESKIQKSKNPTQFSFPSPKCRLYLNFWCGFTFIDFFDFLSFRPPTRQPRQSPSRPTPTTAEMKLNVSYPANGSQKLIEIEDERKLRDFMEKRVCLILFLSNPLSRTKKFCNKTSGTSASTDNWTQHR